MSAQDNTATTARTEPILPTTPILDEESPFATMMSLFDEAAAILGVAPDNYAILRKPDREVAVAVPFRTDDGKLMVADGYRIQHNMGLGPFLGPLRVSTDISVDMLRALAAWMTWKCAVLNIPFGGAAGGLRMDTDQRSRGELERAVRRYTASMLDMCGPERDIFAPDVGTDQDIMAWVVETVSSHVRHTENAAVTGKPLSMNGTLGHEDAVAQGLRVIFHRAIDFYDLPDRGVKVTIQGAGKVGGNLARLLHGEGFRVIGLSDVSGACFNEEGLDVPRLMAWRNEHRKLQGCPGDFELLSNEELLSRPTDVLVPCAIPNAIHSRNARGIEAKLILEGAHGPVSARADRILNDRGIPVVPDIIANAGGVVSNYFEWVQNRQGLSWIEPVVRKRLTRFMTEAWTAVVDMKVKHNVRMRMAANMLAVERVAQADTYRGIYA